MNNKERLKPFQIINIAGIILLTYAVVSGFYFFYASEPPEWKVSYNVENEANAYLAAAGIMLIIISGYLRKREKKH